MHQNKKTPKVTLTLINVTPQPNWLFLLFFFHLASAPSLPFLPRAAPLNSWRSAITSQTCLPFLAPNVYQSSKLRSDASDPH